MSARVAALKVARIVCGATLALLTALWTLLLVRIVLGFATGGADGARGSLHRTILASTLWGRIERDPVAAISCGYECLVLCLLLTWVLREIYACAGKKLAQRE